MGINKVFGIIIGVLSNVMSYSQCEDFINPLSEVIKLTDRSKSSLSDAQLYLKQSNEKKSSVRYYSKMAMEAAEQSMDLIDQAEDIVLGLKKAAEVCECEEGIYISGKLKEGFDETHEKIMLSYIQARKYHYSESAEDEKKYLAIAFEKIEIGVESLKNSHSLAKKGVMKCY